MLVYRNNVKMVGGETMDITVGTIIYRTDDVPPEGWLVCDGWAVYANEYPELKEFYNYGCFKNRIVKDSHGEPRLLKLPDLDARCLIKVGKRVSR